MTGFPGERRNRDVALVTDDFRTYHRLVPFLESYGLKVLVLRPTDPVPTSVRCLIGGPREDPRFVPLLADDEATLLAAFSCLDPRHTPQKRAYERITFGVDPGKVIGLAALADGEPLLVGESRASAAAADRIASWATGLAARRVEVHVGAGAPSVGREVLRLVKQRLPHAAVSLVREEATTPWSHVTGSRHTDAAIHIAMRQPM